MVALLNDAEIIINNAVRAGLALDPKMNIDEWADLYRMLSSEGSAEPGPWRTSRVPMSREVMQVLSPLHPCTYAVLVGPTQMFKTEVGTNWWAYTVDKAPGPFMIVEPYQDMALKLSKTRIAMAIRDTPSLNEKIAPVRSRDGGNTHLHKEYLGGGLIIAIPTPSGFQMVSIRYLWLDEVDSYPLDVGFGSDGDPIAMAKNRTSNYGTRKKIFACSTPKIKDASIIEREYLKSDQRKYYVPCPECKTKQVLYFKKDGHRGIRFEHENYKLVGPVEYACKHCGTLIPEHCKTTMLEQGSWIPENQENGQFPGFWLNALYAPLGWISWADIVTEFLEAKRTKSEPLLKTWVNTRMAETWAPKSKSINTNYLLKRREEYGKEIDCNTVLITAGVDVHPDRVEITVTGWLADQESYVLDHDVLYGDFLKPLLKKNLDKYLLTRTYLHEKGQMPINCTAVDSSFYSSEVHDYCKAREKSRIYAVIGRSGFERPVARTPNRQGDGTLLFTVGSDTSKDMLFGRLDINEAGPGCIHFGMDRDEKYFLGLTAEVLKTKLVKGFKVSYYEKIRDRNEPLDCYYYSLSALYIFCMMVFPKTTVEEMLILLHDKMTGKAIEQERTPGHKGVEV